MTNRESLARGTLWEGISLKDTLLKIRKSSGRALGATR